MHKIRIACLPLLLLVLTPHAHAQQPAPRPGPTPGPGMIVTYVESPAAKAAVLASDLRAYAAQVEKGAEKPTVTLLAEIGLPSRTVVLEQWPDLSSPAVADAATALTAATQADVLAPLDRRGNHLITPTIAAKVPANAFHVLWHVDVGNGAPQTQAALLAQRDPVLAAPGVLGYELAFWDGRPNHFAVHEVWSSRKAYEDYAATAPAVDLRRTVAQFLGAPFDDRFYSILAR